MKKTLCIVCLILITTQMVNAGNVKNLIAEFKDMPKAEFVHIPPFLMKIAKWSMQEEEPEMAVLEKISSVQVLDLEACSETVKKRFHRRITTLNMDDYQPLMTVKEDGEKVQMYILQKKEVIKEMLLIVCGNEDCTLVRIKGNFEEKDLKALANQDYLK